MRLLLAEDDVLLGQAITRALMQLGYAVDWLPTDARVVAAVRESEYDCILLDLGLPDMNGEACLRALRRHQVNVPVVVVTACADTESKVRTLDFGADDYVAKPFDVDELAARIRALVRRSTQRALPEEAVTLYDGSELSMHLGAQTVRVNGEHRDLTTKEFWVLQTLVRHRDRIVTRKLLEESLYGWGDELSSNTIEVYVHQLRRKLGRDHIQTIRGVGYRLSCARAS